MILEDIHFIDGQAVLAHEPAHVAIRQGELAQLAVVSDSEVGSENLVAGHGAGGMVGHHVPRRQHLREECACVYMGFNEFNGRVHLC